MELLNKLPKEAKSIFESNYKSAKSRGLGPTAASKIAMGAVKRGFKKINSGWAKKNTKARLTAVKSGWFSKDYFFNIEIANNLWDDEDQRASEYLLKRLSDEGKISAIGDVDHETYFKANGALDKRAVINTDTGTKGLYKMLNYNFKDGKINATIQLNKDHKLFDKYLKLHKTGKYLYASPEFENCEISDDGTFVDADRLNWTITDEPANKTLAPMSAIV